MMLKTDTGKDLWVDDILVEEYPFWARHSGDYAGFLTVLCKLCQEERSWGETWW